MERNFLQSLATWTSMTCGEAFSAFKKLYSEDQYFHIALTQLLPTVQKTLNATDVVSPKIQCARRILSLYLIYALYAPHPISLNPFHSFLSSVAQELSTHSSRVDSPQGDEILLRYLEVILANEGSTLDCLVTSFLPELASIEIKSPDVPRTELATPVVTAVPSGPLSTTKSLEDERMSCLLLDCQARVLSFSEQRYFIAALRSLPYDMICDKIAPASLSKLASLNSRLCIAVIRRIFGDADAHCATKLSHSLTVLEPYFTALSSLPATLGSFDLIGSLLFEGELTALDASLPSATKDLVSVHVLPQFISSCLQEIYTLGHEQSTQHLDTEGLYARTVQLLCKFVLSIMRRFPRVTGGLSQDTAYVFSEGLDVELTHFALQNAHFSEANALYRALALRCTENGT